MLNRFLLPCLLAILPGAVFAQTVTRVEQNDPRITYTGVWYPNSNALESGGTALLANLKGSQIQVVFNGTGITWIGASDYYAGICYLTLDGVPMTVDTSNPSGATLYQQKLYSVHGLAPGMHRMTVEVIHSHDAETNASWIWVDAFDIDNGTLVGGPMAANPGLIQQGDIAINYSGHWFQTAGAQYSGGSVNSAVDTGARVDVTFNGGSITWMAYRDEWSGLAQVYMDGVLQGTIDTYLTPSKTQVAAYSLGGLPAGMHVLSIIATGTHGAASAGSWIWVDGFQVGAAGAVITPAMPAINAGGVVSAASFATPPNNQVAPGQLVAIFGQNFLASGTASAGTTPLPTQLGPQNTTVTACGRAIPLYYLFPGQINAEIPLECPTAGPTTVTVSVGGVTGTAQTFTLAPAAPGIFTVDGSGAGAGVIVHSDNSLVDSTKPAKGGETVVIYATGLGATTPSFASGSPANQINTTLLPVRVTIGGKDATVAYNGLTQGFVGLYQINVVVPSGLIGAQPVVVTAGSIYASRPGVTMFVQ